MQNDVKTQNKRHKRTQHMCRAMLIWLRKDINFRPVDMYTSLGIPRRTYQDYEAGHRGIPAEVAAAVLDIHQRNRRLMDNMCSNARLPSPTAGYSASEWLIRQRDAEYEAGIIRVEKGGRE